MKYKAHISTGEYEFVEIESDDFESLVEEYQHVENRFKFNDGIDEKSFNQFVDNMLMGQDNHIETWERLSADQRAIAQVIKRSIKRLNYKYASTEERRQY